jgi:hypothetical protein
MRMEAAAGAAGGLEKRPRSSIEVVEDSLSIDGHQLNIRIRPATRDLTQISTYIAPPQKRESLLLNKNLLKNPDDLSG